MTVANTVPPAISGSTVVGSVLHATSGTWTYDNAPISYAYQWERCDAGGANCVDINSAMANAYLLAAADVGHTLRVRVTATEGSGPPASGALTYTPPHYVSGDPTLIGSYGGALTAAPAPSFAANAGYAYNLDDGTDYFLDLGLKEWSAYNFGSGNTPRTGLKIYGGRDVVIVGGEVLFHSTNKYDDCAGIQIIGGDPTGTVYIEGVKITSVNGITWSSQRNGVIQHCYISVSTYQNDSSDGNHPDVMQIWDPCTSAEIFMDRVTGYTTYTGLTALIDQPYRWRRDRVDLHHLVGNYMNYFSPGNDAVTCYYDGGTDNWMQLGSWGGIRSQLQMELDSPSYSPHLTYIVNHAGVDFGPTNDPNYFHTGAGPRDVGNTQGDEWRCTSRPTLTERWKYGLTPDYPNGEFAPAADCGTGYVPVGYA